jgi:hypothetical protein
LPTSRLSRGDALDEGVSRSCLELFGLVPGCIQHLCGLHRLPEYCDEEIIFCRVTDLRLAGNDSGPHRQNDSSRRSRAVSIAEAKAMVQRGAIVDLHTVCGLLLI